jgi:hypothetical protein
VLTRRQEAVVDLVLDAVCDLIDGVYSSNLTATYRAICAAQNVDFSGTAHVAMSGIASNGL